MSLFPHFITNFRFSCQSNILATQTKIDEIIINLLSLVFIFIPSPFSSLAKDARLDTTEIEILSMAKTVSIIFATYNQVLKLESSLLYQHLFIFLLKRHNWIGLLFKRDGMEREID